MNEEDGPNDEHDCKSGVNHVNEKIPDDLCLGFSTNHCDNEKKQKQLVNDYESPLPSPHKNTDKSNFAKNGMYIDQKSMDDEEMVQYFIYSNFRIRKLQIQEKLQAQLAEILLE